MKLRLQAKPLAGATPMPLVFVCIREGRLDVQCKDRGVADLIASDMANQFFIQGKGFPTFELDGAGRFVLDAARRVKLKRFVDLDDDESALLNAIKQNFDLGEQYQTAIVGDEVNG